MVRKLQVLSSILWEMFEFDLDAQTVGQHQDRYSKGFGDQGGSVRVG
jgi:hypothetical protein